MDPSLEEVKKYYDDHTINKLKGFVYTNERVERAWLTIVDYGKNPVRILEIGCGIGDISWRMSRWWPDAEIVGLDISSRSIEMATKLFASSKLKFIEGTLDKGKLSGKFDLILLIDVYEHIAISERATLHKTIKELITEEGKVILSFPTPRHLAWLRMHDMSNIQPIDEDIDVITISKFAQEINKEVILYKELSVWHAGDYAHAVLGSRIGWKPESDRIRGGRLPTLREQLKSKLKEKLKKKSTSPNFQIEERLKLINEKLGESWLDQVKNNR
ncbi:class I SAM-dependent methyltransferase [Rhodocytophaga aerolata]|uniref:Class I SAM-dependent methyltransferase n=1 Tax=Rhodocytophaga aerolata TaxID=455078 RepID=A0ABT8RFW7_9BACT|nr:class I SAM-dependent methyltransferase [Rhodocytophaga aerolata]MDO1451006.1 class I SAM-dependent methyltransferase [Rhodocytophaga aerolata]